MEIIQGILAAIYLFALQFVWLIELIKLALQSWPGLIGCVLIPGLIVGAFLQRLNFSYLTAFLAAEGLLLIFDALFNPYHTFFGILYLKNFTSLLGTYLVVVINVMGVLPFFIAIRLGFLLGRRFNALQTDKVKP